MRDADILTIRERLRELPEFSAANADESPNQDEIYAPISHAVTLDPERALVVGGRGVGKSFWSSVLYNNAARKAVSVYYPKLKLESLVVALGFHENTKGSDSIAPTRNALARALEDHNAVDIWRSVLLRALIDSGWVSRDQATFKATLELASKDPDQMDDIFIKADERLRSKGKRFLLVFDALDRLSNNWTRITELTSGIAQLALELRAFEAIRAKLFMRRDQFNNGEAFRFRDASKLTNARVELFWKKEDLFGWLFLWLWRGCQKEFARLVADALELKNSPRNMPDALRHDEDSQRAVFAALAGPYMGSDRRRGMTDRKVVNSLADAFGEASLRSFSAAIQTAAQNAHIKKIQERPLDHLALNEGIIKASSIRLQELREDHGWIEVALEPLRGLTVPCDKIEFEERWRKERVVEKIQNLELGDQGPSTPIAFTRGANVESLVAALQAIGVVETRQDGRINVPDLFRVAAGMGRKGGVRSLRAR